MYKLVLDEEKLKDFNEFLKNYQVHPDVLSKFSYGFLRVHSRPIVSSIFGDKFIPIRMLVSIRTDRTNELIVPDSGKFYIECPTEYPNEHPLDDLILLAAKSIVDKYFDCGEDLVKVIQRTMPYPVGACLRNDVIYVYVNLLVDCTLKSESIFKLKDCHFERIESISPTSPLEKELLDSLVIVKGDNDA